MVSIRPGPVNLGGVVLDNHLLLAAGILGTTGSSLSRILSSGAGRGDQVDRTSSQRRACRALPYRARRRTSECHGTSQPVKRVRGRNCIHDKETGDCEYLWRESGGVWQNKLVLKAGLRLCNEPFLPSCRGLRCSNRD